MRLHNFTCQHSCCFEVSVKRKSEPIKSVFYVTTSGSVGVVNNLVNILREAPVGRQDVGQQLDELL